ncbi:MAG: hypothetical protein HFF83_09805 [Oscillibacter sp.]|nr:hypothetical protein [Oscillibacter sp.]
MASNNSSKTAHVMNLLSKNRSPEPADTAAPAPDAAPAQETPQAPILTSINEDAAVSSQIKDALEAELSGEVPPAAEPDVGTESSDGPAEMSAENQVAAALEAEVNPDAGSEESQASYAARAEELDESSYVNVMQILVDEKADKYMEMFGLCQCERCKADVRAYALNHLPPKYVFMGRNEMVPRLTVYESKYSSDLVAQLLNACRIVMETPHHAR